MRLRESEKERVEGKEKENEAKTRKNFYPLIEIEIYANPSQTILNCVL
jgi:hypothetical protein